MRDLKSIIAKEALLWGDSEAANYHDKAEAAMDRQWTARIMPVLAPYAPDFSAALDFACGRGRNTRKLLEAGAALVTMVDVNAENVRFCSDRFAGQPVVLVHNNGADLAGVADASQNLFYSWDAMVHFDPRLIESYVPEMYRVLGPGGLAFVHHSNFSAKPGRDFRANPHWRNHMSADLFAGLARAAGFDVLDQHIMDWGDAPELDCITLLRRPA